jgi:hypothetical protein
MLRLGDELAPALDQTFAPSTNDVLGVTVFAQIGGHFLVSHVASIMPT